MFGRPPRVAPPGRLVWAIGDVHGRSDLLAPLLARIAEDVAAHPDAAVVSLGDAVDRGPDAAGALALLRDAAPKAERVCLMGNHERMMLEFLDDPEGRGRRWIRNGGDATLRSFGVDPDAAPLAASRALTAAMPAGLEGWLRALPRLWRARDLVCVHAALHPRHPVDAQPTGPLIWGHAGFMDGPVRADGVWAVHGHVVVPRPYARRGRVAVDSGAWTTGRLTAARVAADGTVRFLTQTGPPLATPPPG